MLAHGIYLSLLALTEINMISREGLGTRLKSKILFTRIWTKRNRFRLMKQLKGKEREKCIEIAAAPDDSCP